MSEIKPALTAEEWAAFLTNHGQGMVGDRYSFMGHHARGADDGEEDYQAAAALCPHGQPFGFTRDDLTWLAVAIDGFETDSGHLELPGERLQSLADRIEALLPPENP